MVDKAYRITSSGASSSSSSSHLVSSSLSSSSSFCSSFSSSCSSSSSSSSSCPSVPPISSYCLSSPQKSVVFSLGICAMECKVKSSPMQSILKRLKNSGDFHIVNFSEYMLLHEDTNNWPVVDCLIAFHSNGFPLEKVIAYYKKHMPITLNDLESQVLIRNRVAVYDILKKWRLPHPKYIIVDHDAVRKGLHTFEEHYDYIVYDNMRLNKPFIEKSIDADNHHNWIYYPKNTGGGCKKLFRKVKDRSSEYFPDVHEVRRNGVYVYEEFLSTFGTDVKVYTVGQMFAHAEARKAPSLDGKVKRTPDGKEVRYPVILSEKEKFIAYQIVQAFQQTVCGFDILRTTSGESVVCDVNGWSFVKGNVKYYNDCAHIIRVLFLTKLQEKYHFIPRDLPAEWFTCEPEEETLRRTFLDVEEETIHPPQQDELCTVVVIMRHGDRKPKQKLKFETEENLIVNYFIDRNVNKEVKLKSTEELQELLQRNTSIIETLHTQQRNESNKKGQDINTFPHFSAFPSSFASSSSSSAALYSSTNCCSFPSSCSFSSSSSHSSSSLLSDMKNMSQLDKHIALQKVLEQGDGFTGINRKIQLKPLAWEDEENEEGEKVSRVTRCLIVAKWGGELTNVGRGQAEDLGRRFRATLYPGDSAGLLRLHSTFRHDFKIYTSDEGRCQVTSAAFTKGFLNLDGELTPILVQLVIRNAKAHSLLDDTQPPDRRQNCKKFIDKALNEDVNFSEHPEKIEELTSAAYSHGHRQALHQVGNPKSCMHKIHRAVEEFINALQLERDRWRQLCPTDAYACLLAELLQEIQLRWTSIQNSWYKKSTGAFDTSKVPDLVDNVRFDLIHHHAHIGNALNKAFDIYNLVEPLGNFIAPGEYGLSSGEKVEIGTQVIHKLLKKIIRDVTFFRGEDENRSKGGVSGGATGGNGGGLTVQRQTTSDESARPGIASSGSSCGSQRLADDSPSSSVNPVSAQSGASIAACPLRTGGERGKGEKVGGAGGGGGECKGVTFSPSSPTLSCSSPSSSSSHREKQYTQNADSSSFPYVSLQSSCCSSAAASSSSSSSHPFSSVAPSLSLSMHADANASDKASLASSIPEVLSSVPPSPLAGSASVSGAVVYKSDGEKGGGGGENGEFEGSCGEGGAAGIDTSLPAGDGQGTNSTHVVINTSDLWAHQNEQRKDKVRKEKVKGEKEKTKSMEGKIAGGGGPVAVGGGGEKDAVVKKLSQGDEKDGEGEGDVEEKRANEEEDHEEHEHEDTDHIRLKEEEARALGIRSPWRIVRSRYYVTSASHLQCLLNILLYAHEVDEQLKNQPLLDPEAQEAIKNVTDLHYLSHIVLRVWENKKVPKNDANRYKLQIQFSSGAKDGFGQNYELLERDAKEELNKFLERCEKFGRIKEEQTKACAESEIVQTEDQKNAVEKTTVDKQPPPPSIACALSNGNKSDIKQNDNNNDAKNNDNNCYDRKSPQVERQSSPSCASRPAACSSCPDVLPFSSASFASSSTVSQSMPSCSSSSSSLQKSLSKPLPLSSPSVCVNAVVVVPPVQTPLCNRPTPPSRVRGAEGGGFSPKSSFSSSVNASAEAFDDDDCDNEFELCPPTQQNTELTDQKNIIGITNANIREDVQNKILTEEETEGERRKKIKEELHRRDDRYRREKSERFKYGGGGEGGGGEKIESGGGGESLAGEARSNGGGTSMAAHDNTYASGVLTNDQHHSTKSDANSSAYEKCESSVRGGVEDDDYSVEDEYEEKKKKKKKKKKKSHDDDQQDYENCSYKLEDVPPYCELAPLLTLTKNCQLSTLEILINAVLSRSKGPKKGSKDKQ